MSDSKVAVTITNRAPGLKPPVYVAGSFSKPEWVPEPMEYTADADGVHTFTKTLHVEPESKIVYKFRVGEGDWWLLNEDAPTVTDDAGNRNNVLDAPALPQRQDNSDEPATEPSVTLGKQDEAPAEDTPNSHSNTELEQPKPVSHAQAFKQSNEADQARISTPELIQTITEVAESAALLDRSTPEPQSREIDITHDEQHSATLTPDSADTAAEVADSAALLDRTTPEPAAWKNEKSVPSEDEETPAEVAAQVADTAAKLDQDESTEAPSEVAAQVADTAEKLDAQDLETPSEVAAQVADSAANPDKDKSVETPAEVAAQVADTAEKLDQDENAEAPSEVAAQVADSAEKLDQDENAEAPSEVAAQVADTAEKLDQDASAEAPSEVAAQVADTAQQLDQDDSIETPSEVAAQVADTAESMDQEKSVETPSEVAAQVADTAEKLDKDDVPEPTSEAAAQLAGSAESLGTHDSKDESHMHTAAPAYTSLAGLKGDMKHESLEIAGYNNDGVPLFPHECPGAYEDDEIPGVDERDVGSQKSRFFHDSEDFDDPTLERFPSTRDEIISTVRKLGTGLNEDQVSNDGTPLSPVSRARGSPSNDLRAESDANSPTSRGSQFLPVPMSPTSADGRSASATSLHSIAEDAEGAEEDESVEPQPKDIGVVVEQANNNASKQHEAKAADESKANEIAPVVEQAETAEEVIEAAREAEGDQKEDFSSTSRDSSSVANIPIENIDAIVDLPPAVQDTTASDVEGPQRVQDIASMVEHTNGHGDAHLDNEPDMKATQGAEGETEEKSSLAAEKPTLEPLVTIPSPAVKPRASLLSPLSDDDEAIAVKSADGKDTSEENTKSGYLTPERAATPQPEEPGSPREPAPNTADPVSEYGAEPDAPGAGGIDKDLVPRSPQIVVSAPKETQPEQDLLPDASLAEPDSREIGTLDGSEESKDKTLCTESAAPTSTEIGEGIQASRDETSDSLAAPSAVNGGNGEVSRNESTAATSSTEDRQTDGLKQRSVGRPDPTDRSATPKSISDSHKEAVKGGNWFSSFLRLIFIDFFGGIMRKLYGGDRKTLVTTAVVLLAIGYLSRQN